MPRTARIAPLLIVLVVGATAVGGCGVSDQGTQDSSKAVEDFLADGVVDHNGLEACQYLTPGEQNAVARRGRVVECRDAFDSARLGLGSQIATEHQVDGLSAASTLHGSRARVTLSRGGESIAFDLVKADYGEREEFQPPDTDWRIAGGALPLIPGP